MSASRNNCGKLSVSAVFLVALLWILGDYQCTCFGLPRFQSVPTTVKTFENNTVTLPCLYSGDHQGIRWYFGDILLIDTRVRFSYTSNDRVRIIEDGSLLVDQVRSEDTGDYFCEVLFADGPPVRQEHSIEVQFPPTVTSYPSGNIRLRLGSVFEITCDATGVPFPIISWRRVHPSGAVEWLLENRRSFRVDITSRQMAGTYQCSANNGIDEPAVAGVNVHVNYIPEVQSPSKTVHTKLGYRAQLDCIVLASPSGTVHWYHDGLLLNVTRDNHIARTDVDVGSEPYAGTHTKHSLIVRSVRDRDLGMYECRASNEMGSKGLLISLTGMPKQSIFKSSPLRSVGRTFNLLWQTESYSPISEYRLKFRADSRRRRTDWREITIPAEYSDAPIHTAAYSLSGLDVGVVYEVAVVARNRFGWGEMSKTYRFATGGEVESPSMISEETVDDSLILDGDDLDNSIDDLPGIFDYSYSGAIATRVRRGVFVLVLINWALVVLLGGADFVNRVG